MPFDYLAREVLREMKSLDDSNGLSAREYAVVMDAYRFVLARIEVARLMK